jgi:hypothetical protein
LVPVPVRNSILSYSDLWFLPKIATSWLRSGSELIPLQKYLFRDWSEVTLIGSKEHIAVRCLTGWIGWILNIYISNYEKPKPPLETSNPYNEHKLKSNKDIYI